MSTNCVNGCVKFGGDMYYAAFGSGEKTAVVIPGLSDGLMTVKGKAAFLVKPYKPFLNKFKVYMFSRRNDIPERHSIADMADDQAEALRSLGISDAYVLGVSQGGMIAQHLAARYPELVERLVLTVTAPCVNDTITEVVGGWIAMAGRGDFRTLMRDTADKSYSEAYLAKHRVMIPLLGLVGKPKSFARFLTNANAILGFDAREADKSIKCPTLIISGSADKTVGTRAAHELRELLPDSEFYIYDGLGHAVYEEAPDFYERVFGFFGR